MLVSDVTGIVGGVVILNASASASNSVGNLSIIILTGTRISARTQISSHTSAGRIIASRFYKILALQ